MSKPDSLISVTTAIQAIEALQEDSYWIRVTDAIEALEMLKTRPTIGGMSDLTIPEEDPPLKKHPHQTAADYCRDNGCQIYLYQDLGECCIVCGREEIDEK